MKAQKVQFIFVEKDPWYRKVANGFSGKAAENARYGCNTHGFKTDSSKYRFSNSFMKGAKRGGRSVAQGGYDEIAFSTDEQPYSNGVIHKRGEMYREATENRQIPNKPLTNRPTGSGEPRIYKRGDAAPDMRPVRHMHEDRRISAALPPHERSRNAAAPRQASANQAMPQERLRNTTAPRQASANQAMPQERPRNAATPRQASANQAMPQERPRNSAAPRQASVEQTMMQKTPRNSAPPRQEASQSWQDAVMQETLQRKSYSEHKQKVHAAHSETRRGADLNSAKAMKKRNSENEIADKLSKAFDDYDATEQSFGMSAAMYQEDLRKKAQQLKEKSADTFSAARDRFTEASFQENTFASKLRNGYERITEQIRESQHKLIVWGAGGAAGFAVCLVISLIIVNTNY